jgi:hypothetical protein
MGEFIQLKQFCHGVPPSDDRLTEETQEYALQWWVAADTTFIQEKRKVTGSEDSKPRSVRLPFQ